jgi:peptide deformylase
MVLDIVTYGNDVLRHPAKPVGAIDDGLRALAQDMLETMYHADGVGLAAEQVGREEAICVIDVKPEYEKDAGNAEFNRAVEMPLVMVNPRIVASEGTQRGTEGCLSFPEIHGQVTRAMQVTFEYTDLDGVRKSAVARGLLARAVQHEVEHLAGKLMIDRFTAVQKLSVAGKLKRLAAR